MSDEQQFGWQERLNFYNAVFGAIGVIALVVSFVSWLGGHTTLLYFSGFVAALFLFLWMLDYTLRSNNQGVEGLGNLLPDRPKELEAKSPAQDLMNGKGALPVVAPQAQPIPTEIIRALEQHYELKKLEPNIVALDGEDVEAYEGESEEIIRGAREGARPLRAVILPLYNNPHAQTRLQPKRRIAGINNVSAEVSYRFFDNRFGFEVHHGTWLSEKDNKVNFPIKAKHYLIAATIEGAGEVYAVERDFDGTHPEGLTNHTPLAGDLFGINIRLIAEDGSVLNKYEMMLVVKREPEFKVELTPARLWKLTHLSRFRREGYELNIKLYEVGKVAHEKGEAVGNFWDAEVLAEKKKQEEEIAERVKEWEARAADFIGVHLSEQQKSSFLKSTPTIEQGLQGVFRFELRPRSQGQEAQKPIITPSHWTLHDSISARTDALEGFGNKLFSR